MADDLNYFALLDVSEDVNQQELEARYRELAEHLASSAIPPQLREWARRQAALVDEAYAILADPDLRTRIRTESKGVTPEEAPAPEASGPDAAPAKEPAEKADSGAAAERAPRVRAAPRPGVLSGILRLRSNPLVLGVVIGTVVLAGILLGRYGLPGGDSGEAAPVADQGETLVPLDTERVAELMAAVEQDPDDAEVLFELGETFFLASEWDSAVQWFDKFLEIDADNVHARTDVGTSHFNMGRADEAEAAWMAVLEINPDDVQAHYNLGFLYANAEPVDLASAQQEWETVMRLAPNSELAKTAEVHLSGLLEGTEEVAPPATPEQAGGTSETN